MKTINRLTGFVCLVAGLMASVPFGAAAATNPVQVPKPFAVAKEGNVHWIRWAPGTPTIHAKCMDAAGFQNVYTTDPDIGNMALTQAVAGKGGYVVVNESGFARNLTGHTGGTCEVINYYVLQ